MALAYDVNIAFEFSELKFLFTEFFYKKLEKPLKIKIKITDTKKENAYKDLVNSSKWISITFFESYFDDRFHKRNHTEFSDLFFKFFELLITKGLKSEFLFKLIFISKNGYKFQFLFEQIHSINFLKIHYLKAITKIRDFRKKDIKTIKEIKGTFKMKSKKVYFKLENENWVLINLLFNAGKYHQDEIAKNLKDNRIAKPDILINREHLNDRIKYKALWQLEVDKKKFIRLKPNDIALYSNIAMKNLTKAKEIYNDQDSILWKYIQMPADEQKLMDYYELIITSIILAYSSIEALVNIAIPRYYFHKRREQNKPSGRLVTKKYSKKEIERWYSMDNKMNVILPEALNIPLPNQQKWWVRFDKLEKLRNKIIHVVESESNKRYSELLEKEIFRIIESHIEVIKFFGKWATDNKHYLLNELPYGFRYDDIMPKLISKTDYNKVSREMRGL